MNMDIAKGSWHQLKGKVREKWGDLTDDEIDQIAGRRSQFIGLMQKKYGVAKEEAESWFDDLKRSCDDELH